MTTPCKPSELSGRSTYNTRSGRQLQGPNDGPAYNGGQPNFAPAGFELIARISPNAGWLPYLSCVFHLETTLGLYILLFDQVNSDDQSNAPPGGQSLVVVGDPALVTLGPNIAPGTIIVFSEADAEAETRKHVGRDEECKSDVQTLRGFPFDRGCVAAVSITPGIFSPYVGQGEAPPLGGVRYTARWQSQRDTHGQ